jgi:hypothetical protein
VRTIFAIAALTSPAWTTLSSRLGKQLNRILQMELAAVIYYTHYSFMIYGHAPNSDYFVVAR